MKKRWTKYLAVLCAAVCMFSVTGCGSEEEKKEELTYSEDTEKTVNKVFQGQYDPEAVADQVMQYYVTSYTSTDRETLETQYKEYEKDNQEEETEAKNLSSYLDATDGVGEYKDNAYNLELEMEDESLTLTGTMEFEKREVMFTCTLDMSSGDLTLAFEKDLTLGEILAKAGMNTLLGMGTVFAVLILISAIISCFKFVNGSEKKKKEGSAEAVLAQKAEAEAAQETETAEDVTDDLELAAVIAAAIAAAEGTSADGFTVRSIKRVNNAKWRKA